MSRWPSGLRLRYFIPCASKVAWVQAPVAPKISFMNLIFYLAPECISEYDQTYSWSKTYLGKTTSKSCHFLKLFCPRWNDKKLYLGWRTNHYFCSDHFYWWFEFLSPIFNVTFNLIATSTSQWCYKVFLQSENSTNLENEDTMSPKWKFPNKKNTSASFLLHTLYMRSLFLYFIDDRTCLFFSMSH